jgi:diguanylate cyclase (GGDEF)-like protein
VIAVLIVAVGLSASAFLAYEWRAGALDANRKSFASTSADLGSSLGSRLKANLSLTRAMRSIATLEPQASETRFMQWYHQLQRGSTTSTDIVAVLIQPIPASQLASFKRQVEGDPRFRAVLGGRFQILPPGRRKVYCLTRAIVGNPLAISLYPGLFDYCAPALSQVGRSPVAALAALATDTGAFVATPLPGYGRRSMVAVGAAVYRLGAHLQTVGERRRAFTGSVGTTFDGGALVKGVLGTRATLMISLDHQNPGGPIESMSRAGASQRGRSGVSTERISLSQGWSVIVSGTAEHPIAANSRAVLALALGALITALAYLLFRVLTRSRERAWGLVGERTGELEYSALHDPLTDLPNRGLVLDRAEQILARARRLGVPATALFMDIDDFKQINDRYGHQVGDEVLRHVGERLRSVLRDNDTVGRLGGDEFVMLIDSVGFDATPDLLAERILEVLRQPIELPGHAPVTATASIGIATGMPGTAEQLMQDADLALYKAKALGKDGYALFESAMHVAAQDRIRLEMDLGEAVANGELFLVYQPMLNLETERVVGVEALLRWQHPRDGVIAPEDFIPIAEESGLIVPIGRWVLEQACTQGAAWHAAGHTMGISVNVSTRQLERPAFATEVREALLVSGLAPEKLTLEITETVLMRRPDITAGLLRDLKTLGVRIAVDDFGTGYSSLAYLRKFPVDSLKIDRTFITSLARSGEAQALAHTLIQLGKALGLQTLAEGVEDRDQVLALQREGCDLAQGYLFARPLTAPVLERFLEEQFHTVHLRHS